MLTFIDVDVYRTSNPNEKPSKSHFSFSNSSYPDRLFVSGLSHGDEITLDKTNSLKLIDFLQKNIIEAETKVQKFHKKDRVTLAGNTTIICGTIEAIGAKKQGENAEIYVVWDELLHEEYGPRLNMGWYGEDEIVKVN